jgi:hypothetical protein
MRHDTQSLQQTLACQECRRPWLELEERWRMYVLAEEQAETLLYCPVCASREFDTD